MYPQGSRVGHMSGTTNTNQRDGVYPQTKRTWQPPPPPGSQTQSANGTIPSIPATSARPPSGDGSSSATVLTGDGSPYDQTNGHHSSAPAYRKGGPAHGGTSLSSVQSQNGHLSPPVPTPSSPDINDTGRTGSAVSATMFAVPRSLNQSTHHPHHQHHHHHHSNGGHSSGFNAPTSDTGYAPSTNLSVAPHSGNTSPPYTASSRVYQTAPAPGATSPLPPASSTTDPWGAVQSPSPWPPHGAGPLAHSSLSNAQRPVGTRGARGAGPDPVQYSYGGPDADGFPQQQQQYQLLQQQQQQQYQQQHQPYPQQQQQQQQNRWWSSSQPQSQPQPQQATSSVNYNSGGPSQPVPQYQQPQQQAGASPSQNYTREEQPYNSVSAADLDEDNDPSSNVPLPFQPHSPTAEYCRCPSCLQGAHIASVFANQRQASRHVMAARPSPYHTGTGGIPPPPPPLPRSTLRRCPVFDAFGFCSYSTACFLRHIREPTGAFIETAAEPLVPRARSAEEEVARLVAKATKQRDEPLWTCDVCGYHGIDDLCVATVGTTYYYRYCPQCTHHCYSPYVTYLVEHILESVGDDYQQYKTLVDHYRSQAPDEFKVPITAEAHRVGSIVFAWSLVSPAQVRDALEVAYSALPEMEAIVSMGSAAGYVEHIFNRVMHPGVPATQAGGVSQRKVAKSRFPTTAFDGVRVSFYGKKTIPIYAFDEIGMRLTYSVHVSLGGPLVMLSMHCPTTVLLLSWPPFGAPDEEQSSMGFETLEYFTRGGGRVFIYIGDVSTTGDWRFHQLLYTQYKLAKAYPVRREVRRWCPAEMGFVFSGNDTIGVYERRETPIALPPNWACTM